MDDQRFIELIKQHLDFEIVKDYDDFENADFKVYSETTADGYEVFVATYDDRNVSVCEDVHYYDHDLAGAIKQEIHSGMVVYIEEYLYDDIHFDDELVDPDPDPTTKTSRLSNFLHKNPQKPVPKPILRGQCPLQYGDPSTTGFLGIFVKKLFG